MAFRTAAIRAAVTAGVCIAAPIARTPPMGWMSWQTFRCAINCTAAPEACIDEMLYRAMADELVAGGYAAAGYNGIHLDDCIMDKNGRDKVSNKLVADPSRFPSGFKALGDYIHGMNLTFAMYTAESTTTCGGWPGSAGFETLDAQTFAAWGADYLKADGCGDPAYYSTGYPLLGSALQASGRDIVFSCSWPAYLGDDESQKPFGAFIEAGCNLWRNGIDMAPTSGYVQGILEHFGNYSQVLSMWAGPGHWNDPDMLLIGNDCISDDLAKSQMALYGILAAPLILGTDMRKMKPSHRSILLNADAIAVSQDPAGRAGLRLGGAAAANAPSQVWYRPLENGDVAVALYNAGPPPAHPWHTACDANSTNVTQGGYWGPAGVQPESWCAAPGAFSQELFDWYCCNTEDCAGYNFSTVTGEGCWFKDVQGGWVDAPDSIGSTKVGFSPPFGTATVISLDFASVGMFPGPPRGVQVYDIWAQSVVGVTNATSWNVSVPWQGTAYYRLSVPPLEGPWQY